MTYLEQVKLYPSRVAIVAFFFTSLPMSSSPPKSDKPTKEPFSSAGESKSSGSTILFGLVAAPFAAVGGCVDQVSRKVMRAVGASDDSTTSNNQESTNKTND